MNFDQLRPRQLAQIPRMHARPGEQLPPVVRVEVLPIPCGDGGCADLVVVARDITTGAERIYHRPPDFDVVAASPAINRILQESA